MALLENLRPSGRSGCQDSVLFCEELTTLDKTFLADGPRGRVDAELLDQVVLAVRRALGDFSA